MSFLTELRRRNVIRVAIAYLVIAWLVLQVADLMIDNIGAPDWLFQAILMVLGIGFLFALVFSWIFELTSEGLMRDADAERNPALARNTSQKLNLTIIVALALAAGYFFWESRLANDKDEKAEKGPDTFSEQAQSVNGISQQENVSGPFSVAASDRSIAVLPFLNMSSDPEQEYFSDGITEEIINAVVKIPGVSVPARTTVFGYKNHRGDLRTVGQELGVAHILEGSIRSQGDQVRITAQLIKVDDGFHLWSESYDRKLENIFAVQEEIAGAIASVIVGELGAGVTTVPNQTSNMAAYDLYLQGRALLRERDPQARELLNQVTRADPEFAPAWAALAISYQSMNDDNALAMQMADRALALDPDNVDALTAKASALRSRREWSVAERLYEQALAIDPNSAELLEDYAEFLAFVGRTREALEVTRRGVSLDPVLAPLAVAHFEALLSNGLVKEAQTQNTQWIARHPEGGWSVLASLPVWLTPLPESGGVLTPPPEISMQESWSEELRRELQATPARLREGLTPAQVDQLKTRYSKNNPEEGASISYFTSRIWLVQAGELDHVIEADLAGLERPGEATMHEWAWTEPYAALRRFERYPEFLQKSGLVEYWDATSWPDWCQRDAGGVIRCK